MIAAILQIQNIGQLNFLANLLNRRSILQRTVERVEQADLLHKIIICLPYSLKSTMMGNSFKQEIFNPRPNSNVVVFCGETENINHTIHAALVKYNVDDLVFINPRSCFISPDLIDKNIANYKSNGSLASHNRDVDAEDFHINILPFWKFAQNLHMVLEDIVNINHGMGSISQLPKKIGFLDDMIFADYMVAELDRGADIKDLIEDLNAHQSQVNSK